MVGTHYLHLTYFGKYNLEYSIIPTVIPVRLNIITLRPLADNVIHPLLIIRKSDHFYDHNYPPVSEIIHL